MHGFIHPREFFYNENFPEYGISACACDCVCVFKSGGVVFDYATLQRSDPGVRDLTLIMCRFFLSLSSVVHDTVHSALMVAWPRMGRYRTTRCALHHWMFLGH